jgi:hypothetical protein
MIEKYILTIALFVISYLGFSQSTPTPQFRILNRVTSFGQNLPAGSQIYVLSDSTLWQTKRGIITTATITTAYNDLELINRRAIYSVETFEASSPSSSTYTLLNSPIKQTLGITVMMNGAALRPTTDYTCSGKVLTIAASQLQYDKFVVSYTYTFD